MVGCGNSNKAKEMLGWKAQSKMHDVVKKMVEAER
jgi:GDP-D-mannose dehydratase